MFEDETFLRIELCNGLRERCKNLEAAYALAIEAYKAATTNHERTSLARLLDVLDEDSKEVLAKMKAYSIRMNKIICAVK